MELVRAKRELAETSIERDLLKIVTVYFARELRQSIVGLL